MNTEERLGSWKEIGAYLQRDARTARRWEVEEGLPVHRHTHKSRSSVYAYPSEIDAWRAARKLAVEPAPPKPIWRSPAFALTMLMCLIMVGNGVRPASAQSASTKGDRAVWTGEKIYPYGRVSPDSRFIAARDRSTGGLMVHDIEANFDRLLEAPGVPYDAWTRHSAISMDGKQVIYEWWDKNKAWRLAFHIASLQGSPQPREVFLGSDDILSGGLRGFDWSPDRKWLVAAIRRRDRTGQIALIALSDGSIRVLKSLDWNVPERIFFSTDSRYIAYDRPAGDGTAQRDIFILAIDGSREVPAVVNPANEELMGWSPDGTRLLFSSDRTGSAGLWGLRFADGKVQGDAELLKSDIGASYSSMGVTAAGGLYVYKRMGNRDVSIAPIDLEAGKLLGPPTHFTRGFVFDARHPTWSPDGKYLAYPVEDGSRIVIRSVESGMVRLLPSTLNYVPALNWFPDGRSLLTNGTDLKGRDGIFQIDVESGKATILALSEGNGGQQFAERSPDGKKVYFRRERMLIEHDIVSGAEKAVGPGGAKPLSPDGQYFVQAQQPDPSTKTSRLLVRPAAGGQPRELLLLNQPEEFVTNVREVWTPDSRAVLVVKNAGARNELWLVPLIGSPRKLDIDPNLWMEGSIAPGSADFSLSPDGHSIAFETGKSTDEVWALEKFLPKREGK